MKLMLLFMVAVVMVTRHVSSSYIEYSSMQENFVNVQPQQIHLAIGGKSVLHIKSNLESSCIIQSGIADSSQRERL